MKVQRSVGIIALLLLFFGARSASAADLALAWDPSPDPSVVGYIVGYGLASGSYSQTTNVGNTTTHTATNLSPGVTYYFVVVAYNAAGTISSLSNEVHGSVGSNVVTGLELTSSAPSPQLVGASVTWLATATGGTPPYEFAWGVNQGGQWTVQPWITSASMTWTPTASGDYQVGVAVRSAGSTSSGDLTRAVPFTVTAPSTGNTTTPTTPTTTCTNQAPTVAMAAAAAMSYNVTIKNNNSSGCAPSTFTVSAAAPAGWSTSFAPTSSASLAPGASASANLALTAPTGTSGTYSFTVNGTDTSSGQTGSAVGSATVVASTPPVTTLDVTVSVSLSGGKDPAANIKVRVRAGSQGSPAVLKMTVTSPKGVVQTLDGTAGSDGGANARLPVNPNDSGVYQVQVSASNNAATGTASTTFTVK